MNGAIRPFSLLVVAQLSLCALSGCDPTKERRRDGGAAPLSAQAERLLRVVEDETADGKVRADAARDLGKLQERAAVDRLLGLLPGGDNRLTAEVIEALGDIGDPRALPVLESLKHNYGSKNSTILHVVIRELREKRNNP